jgi:hypothetical protein
MDNIEEKINADQTKIVLDNVRISNYVTGQRWITLKGDFTSSELYDIADKIEAAYNKAFKNGNQK